MRWNIFDRFSRRKKFYLTKEGLEKIKKEYEILKKLKRAKLKKGSPDILHSDEIDPEFIAFRKDLDFLNSRISQVEKILRNVKMIEPPPEEEQDKIHLGAKILVEVEGQEDEFFIVGTLEADPALGKISNESPVGKALMDHKIGDEVVITSPVKVIYKIKDVRYEE